MKLQTNEYIWAPMIPLYQLEFYIDILHKDMGVPTDRNLWQSIFIVYET